ncbi:phosphoglycerol transferase I [Marinobacter litoralis]|uniref:Phosphoglycerol transferase I n=1 Tax=Marinobacter litoralis TaxID=187981 RepID=A0A3M2RKW1_9GAMM|nr:sulfatase-like hydrolase/transferase [Marinobacter litoralis]RMJ05976.1 phosphoglycerol transferase I [Marinobacter litoralis]
MTKPHRLTRHALTRTFLLSFGWLVVVRGLLILQSGVVPSMPGMLGGDIAGAILLTLILQGSRGILRGLVITALGCALYVAGMHLTAHGTLFQLAFAGKSVDSTFISGSLLNVYLLTLPVYLALAWLLHRLHRRWVPLSRPQALPFTGAAAATLIIYSLSFPSLTTPANNLVVSTLAQIPGALINPVGTAIGNNEVEISPDLENRTHFFHQQVSGRNISPAPNVLLIMIEGMSGGYLPSVSNYHGLSPVVSLPNLEQTFNNFGFRIYKNVLSMERQTDRGTFTLTCGRYPDLRRASEKVRLVAGQQATPDCLPEKLQAQGYHTAYWQAAPIEYMNKDEFMPQAGYMDVTGAEVFTGANEAEGWGPPDPVFFSNITTRLRSLDRQHQPWFVTTLNVGTHHPFNIGDKTEKRLASQRAEDDNETILPIPSPQTARINAMKVMAETLDNFLQQLEQDGILENTLVIVTSDESGGFIREDHETLPLNNNVGMLAVKPAAQDSLSYYAPDTALISQLDIAISVLDASGHGSTAGGMIGTSLLAMNSKPTRDLLLADTYTGMKYFLRNEGKLLACTELMTRCQSWTFDPKRIFGTLAETDEEPFLTLEERLALVENANRLTTIDN